MTQKMRNSIQVTSYVTGRPSVAVLERTRDFAALEEEWEDLFRASPIATPFQSWAWLYSWWECYGADYKLRLVTVRDGTVLVGILPFALERRGGFSRLLFIGKGSTDYLDALARSGWEDRVCETGVRVLGQMNSWRVVDLQQVRPEAVAWGVFHRWSGPRSRVWQDASPVIDVKTWDELVASLGRNHRSTVRRALRRAEADGVRCEVAEEASIEVAARRLVALHRAAWQGRAIAPDHLTRRFEAHIVTAARRMATRGLGGISEFWRDGEVIISNFWVSGRDFVGTYMLGASPAAARRYQWSSLYIWDSFNVARRRSRDRLDLLQGEEPYKRRWSSRAVPTHRLILGRNPIVCGPYAGYHALHSWCRRTTRSETSPRWVRKIGARYHDLRHAITGRYRAESD